MRLFDKQGYSIRADNGTLRINHGSLTIVKGVLRNGVYILQGNAVSDLAATVSVNLTQMWYQRLGHISEKGLVELSKQDLLNGDKIDKLDFCEHCALGKRKEAKVCKITDSY